ncbi:MAG: cytochrome c peroxidase, partial [Methyloligellaceae bacterium]
MKAEYVRPQSIPSPKENKLTDAKIDLGHKLYFDPRISKNGVMSCATCHNPGLGWEDGLPTGLGHKGNRLGRHS